MRRLFFASALLIILFSCTQTKNIQKIALSDSAPFIMEEISADKTYGFSPNNPVEVGGNSSRNGPANERRYLSMLSGPNGEKVSFYRAGSCCPVKSDKGLMGYAMLDNYRVTWEGSLDTVSIYINMYDRSVLKAPVGFTIKKD